MFVAATGAALPKLTVLPGVNPAPVISTLVPTEGRWQVTAR